MKILFIGDIFGRPGRAIVKDRLPELREKYAVDLVIAWSVQQSNPAVRSFLELMRKRRKKNPMLASSP